MLKHLCQNSQFPSSTYWSVVHRVTPLLNCDRNRSLSRNNNEQYYHKIMVLWKCNMNADRGDQLNMNQLHYLPSQCDGTSLNISPNCVLGHERMLIFDIQTFSNFWLWMFKCFNTHTMIDCFCTVKVFMHQIIIGRVEATFDGKLFNCLWHWKDFIYNLCIIYTQLT